jgi:hypothetical protein
MISVTQAETGKAVETIFFSVWIVNKLAAYSIVAAHPL